MKKEKFLYKILVAILIPIAIYNSYNRRNFYFSYIKTWGAKFWISELLGIEQDKILDKYLYTDTNNYFITIISLFRGVRLQRVFKLLKTKKLNKKQTEYLLEMVGTQLANYDTAPYRFGDLLRHQAPWFYKHHREWFDSINHNRKLDKLLIPRRCISSYIKKGD